MKLQVQDSLASITEALKNLLTSEDLENLINSTLKAVFDPLPEFCFKIESLLLQFEILHGCLKSLKYRKETVSLNKNDYDFVQESFYKKKEKSYSVNLKGRLYYLEQEMKNVPDEYPFFTQNGLLVGSKAFFYDYLASNPRSTVQSFSVYYSLVRQNFEVLSKIQKGKSKKYKKKSRFFLSDLIYSDSSIYVDAKIADLFTIFKIHKEEAQKYADFIKGENEKMEDKRNAGLLKEEDFSKRFIYCSPEKKSSKSSESNISTQTSMLIASSPKGRESKRIFYKKVNVDSLNLLD